MTDCLRLCCLALRTPSAYKVMVCNSTEAWMAYKMYAQLPVVIGEWSLAVNYNENLRYTPPTAPLPFKD